MSAPPDNMTVEAIIREGGLALKGVCATPMLDARVLTGRVLGLDAAGLILAGREFVSHAERREVRSLIERRRGGEPVSHILGEREFRSLNFRLRPGVLAPRPDSEALIDAAEAARPSDAGLRILDLGVGSGCLLVALLASFRNAGGVGVDCNGEACALARENAQANGVADRAFFIAGDWGAAVNGEFDLVVTNPPYIAETERAALPAEVRDYEDPRALFGGADGLSAYRAILGDLDRLTAENGLVVMELGAGQAQTVRDLAKVVFPAARFADVSDLSGVARALVIDGSSGNRFAEKH